MTTTSIEWTQNPDGTPGKTWNPVRGCSMAKGSEKGGCLNCYAARMAARGFSWAKGLARMTPNGPRWTGVVRLVPELLDEPLRWRKPQRVFVNSMSDLFHEALDAESIKDVFDVMALADRHTFQILTKRPQRMRDLLTLGAVTALGEHPLTNVWLGVSVEDQATADERIPLLLQTPAAVRFVSYEPALGPVDFDEYLRAPYDGCDLANLRLDWLIVGGESGPGARPFEASWARHVVRTCHGAGIAAFVKQMGANVIDRNDRLSTDRPAPEPYLWPEPAEGWDDGPRGNIERTDDGYQGAPVRIRLHDRKGGDPAEWPEDLRVREFPKEAA